MVEKTASSTNECYTVEFSSPLVRPGVKIVAGPVSKRYLQCTIDDTLRTIRALNDGGGIPVAAVADGD